MPLNAPSQGAEQPLEQYEADKLALQNAEQELGVSQLVGRVTFGLDPAAMMVIPDVQQYTKKIIKSFGTTIEKVWPLVKELHEKGPWKFVDRLHKAQEPEIKAYIAMVEACQEKSWPGYSPEEYLQDRERVIQRLSSFNTEAFESRKQSIIANRLKGFEDATETREGKEIKVAIAEGDPALSLALLGYHGCVVRAGDMRFAQTQNIPDDLLREEGYEKGFAEVYDPNENGFVRVPPETPGARVVWVGKDELVKDIKEMKPAIKRIAPGYLLTYNDEDLALHLVKKSILTHT